MLKFSAQRSLAHFVATGAYSGLLPKSPGTWGSFACLILWYFLLPLEALPTLGWVLPIIVTLLGLLCTKIVLAQGSEQKQVPQSKDPQYIVIDEWAGLLIPLSVVSRSDLLSVVLAFTLFRLFDIWKPGPVAWAEQLPGALGVMADDVVAGILGLLVLLVISSILGPFVVY